MPATPLPINFVDGSYMYIASYIAVSSSGVKLIAIIAIACEGGG